SSTSWHISVVLIVLLLAQIRPETRQRPAHPLARRRLVHPARRRQLAERELALVAQHHGLPLARLELGQGVAGALGPLPLQRQLARVAPASGVVHQPEARLAPGPHLHVPAAEPAGDAEEEGADRPLPPVLREGVE